MGACNSRCRFCMVQDEIKRSTHMPQEELFSILDSLQSGEEVDFFGGEPTLHPNFYEAIESAAARGLCISVATNGRIAAIPEHARRLAAISGISIRTSLYGVNAAVHNYYTRAPGSFEETIKGIQNLINEGNCPLVNIVILPKNVLHLSQMINVLGQLGVERIKISSVYGGSDITEYLVDLNSARTAVQQAIIQMHAHGMTLQIEKSPMCLAPLFINVFIPETDPEMLRSSGTTYSHAVCCKTCSLRLACVGIPRAYLQRFGDSGIIPFDRIPEYAVRHVHVRDLADYRRLFPTEFVEVDRGTGQLSTQDAILLSRFVAMLNNKHLGTHIIDHEGILYESP